MPLPWLLLHVAPPAIAYAQAAPPQKKTLPGDLTVTYQSSDFDTGTQRWTFDKGVVLRYDLTVVRTDKLEIDLKKQVGIATGNVRLTDPVGTIQASKLVVWWSSTGRHGHIENAFIKIGLTRLRAKTVDITPKAWVLRQVEGTTSLANPPWFEVHSPEVVIHPGSSGAIEHPELYVLDHYVATLPTREFNLDPRTEGIGFPGINFSREYGIGASWGGGLLIDHATDFSFGFGAFPQALPSYGAGITHSFLPDATPTTNIAPYSDFAERFWYGFLEDVAVEKPESEDSYVRSPQNSVQVQSVWNQGLADRAFGVWFSKAGEIVYEIGGQSNGYGFMTQARLQTIREENTPFITRTMLAGDLAPPPIHLTPNLRTVLRFDTNVFLGVDDYMWVRGIGGLAYQPVPQLRLTGGVYDSFSAGTPALPIDPLVSRSGYVFRTDMNLGPTKISYLIKYDPTLYFWDREYEFSQDVGCFQPFLLYRENPSEYQLGLRLRIDNLTSLVDKRNFNRPSANGNVISPGLDGNP